jgi:hypothetical protein
VPANGKGRYGGGMGEDSEDLDMSVEDEEADKVGMFERAMGPMDNLIGPGSDTTPQRPLPGRVLSPPAAKYYDASRSLTAPCLIAHALLVRFLSSRVPSIAGVFSSTLGR